MDGKVSLFPQRRLSGGHLSTEGAAWTLNLARADAQTLPPRVLLGHALLTPVGFEEIIFPFSFLEASVGFSG